MQDEDSLAHLFDDVFDDSVASLQRPREPNQFMIQHQPPSLPTLLSKPAIPILDLPLPSKMCPVEKQPFFEVPSLPEPPANCRQMRSFARSISSTVEVRDPDFVLSPETTGSKAHVLSILNGVFHFPQRALFKLSRECTVHCILYDMYYDRNNLLRALMFPTMDPHSVFDFFAFDADMCHMFTSCRSVLPYIHPGALSMSGTFSRLSVYVPSETSFADLTTLLPRQVQKFKANTLAPMWISDWEKKASSMAASPVPRTYRSIPAEQAHRLFASPALTALDKHSECVHREKTGEPCPCSQALKELPPQEKQKNVVRLLSYMQSRLPDSIQWITQPARSDVLRAGLLSEGCVKKQSSVLTAMERPMVDARGTYLRCFAEDCSEHANCFWIDCCNKRPVSCFRHASELVMMAESPNLSTCPVHQITGQTVRIL